MPDNTDVIELSLTGLDEVLKGFKSVQDAADSLGKTVGGLGRKSGGGSGSGSAPSGPSRIPRAPSERAKANAAQRDEALRQQLASRVMGEQQRQAAKTAREQARTEAVTLRLKQQKERAERASVKPGFTKRLDTFIRSTRFGAAGVQPLIGRTVDLLGEGSKFAGPLGLLANGAFEAAKALKSFADDASEKAGAFSSIQHSTGATPVETAQLKSLAAALHMDPGALAATAAGIGTAASSNGLAASYASKAHISLLPPSIGHLDQIADLKLAADYLRSLPHTQAGEKEATMAARSLGADALLPLRDVKTADYDRLMKQAQNTAIDKDSISKAAGYSASEANLTSSVDKLRVSIDNSIAPWLAKLANDASGKVDAADRDVEKYGLRAAMGKVKLPAFIENAKWLPSNQAVTDRWTKNMPSSSAPSPLTQASATASPVAKTEDKHTEALQKHTDALNKNSSLIGVPGTYGNATRGEAVREGQTGAALHMANRDKYAFRLGAF